MFFYFKTLIVLLLVLVTLVYCCYHYYCYTSTSTSNTTVRIQVISVFSDAAAGGTDDYVKSLVAVVGMNQVTVKYTFVAELRGSDFVIDKSQIQASFEEIWSGIVAMCDTIAAKEQQASQ